VLSKGSEWASQWANFKDNNPLVNRTCLSARLLCVSSSWRGHSGGVPGGCASACVSVVSLGLFELKMRYDESDNIAVRMTRTVTDTLSERLGV
jgi:hypothetical protein